MTDKPEPIVDQMLAGHRQMIKQLRGVPGVTSEKMVEGIFQKSAIERVDFSISNRYSVQGPGPIGFGPWIPGSGLLWTMSMAPSELIRITYE